MKTPVTVLTGFLGAGKTTLLNRILSENHGLRIAVIENEFGELGVDNHLVIQADEEIFEMNNGCICCTVRGDLIRILGRLAQKKDRFDRVLIETTGMADPGPVAQTFFVDEDVKANFEIDGIITVVDAKHVLQHLDDSEECKQQVAFADRILLNKVDLVNAEDLDHLRSRIERINPFASLEPCVMGQVNIASLLNVGGFKLDRALEIKPQFLAPEYPFEWVGFYNIKQGTIEFVAAPGRRDSMSLVFMRNPSGQANMEAFTNMERDASNIFRQKASKLYAPKGIEKLNTHWDLKIGDKERQFPVDISETGDYVVFAGRCPHEGDFYLQQGSERIEPQWHKHFHSHKHDDSVTSISLQSDRALNPEKFNKWISHLLQTQGEDIFRSKGVLNLKGQENPYVFQAVHMMVDGSFDERGWNRERKNQMVFIGRNLNSESIQKGFEKCLI